MLMKPEPWGEALDAILPEDGSATVIFTSPAGEVFNQKLAYELAEQTHIVFACGRYEGIDQRVVDYASTKANVRMISIGDYVLNGGEVAALATLEPPNFRAPLITPFTTRFTESKSKIRSTRAPTMMSTIRIKVLQSRQKLSNQSNAPAKNSMISSFCLLPGLPRLAQHLKGLQPRCGEVQQSQQFLGLQ